MERVFLVVGEERRKALRIHKTHGQLSICCLNKRGTYLDVATTCTPSNWSWTGTFSEALAICAGGGPNTACKGPSSKRRSLGIWILQFSQCKWRIGGASKNDDGV